MCFNEIENSRLDNKLLFVESLINDNKIGIGIYTAGDLKLVKANQKHIKLLFKSTLDCKNIAIDDEKLERIILNLLSNAIKFTDEGGTITVSLCKNEDNRLVNALHVEFSYIYL